MFVGWMDGWMNGFICCIFAMWTLEPHSVSGFPQNWRVMEKDLEIILFFINGSSYISQWHNVLKSTWVQVSNFYNIEFPLILAWELCIQSPDSFPHNIPSFIHSFIVTWSVILSVSI